MINIQKLALKLEGLQTIDTICKILNVKRSTAYEYISMLKKGLYAKEFRRTSTNKRIYTIKRTPFKEPEANMKEKKGIFDIINENSPLKIEPPFEYTLQRENKLSIEEALVEAIKTRRFKVILASLPLFNKIENWQRLYHYAKINDIRSIIGALYDITKKFTRVRNMDLRTRNALLKYTNIHHSVIPNIKSPDFKEIQKLWNVDIPFRTDDMMRLKWRKE